MVTIIIKESQLIKLIETGSNSAAMDLDIYTSVNTIPSDNGNLDTEETMKQIIDKVKELLAMSKGGVEIKLDSKLSLSKALDMINKGFEATKFKD